MTLATVAAEAGYSRMAVYRHFGSRAGMLTALLAHVDQAEGAQDAVRLVLSAPTPRACVEGLIAWWSRYVPQFAGIARGVLAGKHADRDLAAAWESRMLDLRRVCDAAAARCATAQATRPDLADQLWVLLSVPLWIQLSDEGWDTDRYVSTMTALALASLAPPPP